MRTGRGDRGGETRVVECGDGELVGVSGGGEERGVMRIFYHNHGKPHGLKKWNASLIKTSIYFL